MTSNKLVTFFLIRHTSEYLGPVLHTNFLDFKRSISTANDIMTSLVVLKEHVQKFAKSPLCYGTWLFKWLRKTLLLECTLSRNDSVRSYIRRPYLSISVLALNVRLALGSTTIIKKTLHLYFTYITKEVQLIQYSLLLLSALYMFRAVFPPIIRSS